MKVRIFGGGSEELGATRFQIEWITIKASAQNSDSIDPDNDTLTHREYRDDKDAAMLRAQELFNSTEHLCWEVVTVRRQIVDWWTRIDMRALRKATQRRHEQKPQTLQPTTFVLISCSKSKLTHRAPARELYTGQLFRKAVAWAESHGHQWFVISALHGLVKPDQELDPYDYTIKDRRGARERESWAHLAASDLSSYVGKHSHAVLIMPNLYRRFIETELQRHAITYENPVASMAIGQQMLWLMNN